LDRNDIGKGNKSLEKNKGNQKSGKLNSGNVKIKNFFKQNIFKKLYISGTSKSGNYFYRNSPNQEISKSGNVKIC